MKEFKRREAAATSNSILARIVGIKSPEEDIKVVEEYLVGMLSRLLMIGAEDFEADTNSVASYGLDSMIGAEFRNWVFRELKVDVPFQQLLASNLTIRRFAGELYGKSTVDGDGDLVEA